MQTLVTSPIFIFLTGLADIIIVVLVIVVLAYLIKIMRNLSHMSDIAKIESEYIMSDIEEAREDIKEGVKTGKRQLKVLAGALTAKRALALIVRGVSKIREDKK